MNHPTNEEWISFCYHEVSNEERARLVEHLQACPQCSAAVKSWQRTQKDLDVWHLPTTRKQATIMPFLVKWAAAALLLFTSFCLGRLSLAAPEAHAPLDPGAKEQLRHELSALIQQEVNKAASSITASSEAHTRQHLANALTDLRAEQLKSTRAVYATLQKMEAQRAADYLALKKDLDTLAVNADAQLRTTERHLMQVASFAQTINPSATP
ncbi:MAG TPA: hypothetical protein VL361_23185 [Candidatus Limnocylindrales bacterium]|nr:hypothetical protein [Candidatus Limnocylindrales bacterium]